ncbi:hypothetical protein [Sediminivirga luteola]|uniref:Uncharacterized protein n=1 Tax=Sediminivirga luteola TaxID=1774748 RepID=A0A8J2TY19_9MICO|nr:hypothetical protein [Sediminivirga luteola]MCI2266466.1 hypothetical protein [Sediminivirga luteola]GGA14954.1 hypothetical protein GCM10011333_17460 [Sediminivirga luteola]
MTPSPLRRAAGLPARLHLILATACTLAAGRLRGERDSDRGDVPGWVLITIMTAGLVVTLWALAGTAFTEMFQDALDRVRRAGQ